MYEFQGDSKVNFCISGPKKQAPKYKSSPWSHLENHTWSCHGSTCGKRGTNELNQRTNEPLNKFANEPLNQQTIEPMKHRIRQAFGLGRVRALIELVCGVVNIY